MSPLASPDRAGDGARSGPGPSMSVPPEDRRLSTLRRLHRVGETTPAAGPPGVEDIGRDPPHPWDEPERVMRTYLHHGDRCDVVEEEDVEPLTESLRKNIANMNAKL